MKFMRKNYKRAGMLWGAALGFGAPVGSLLFKMLFSGEINLGWVEKETVDHLYYYAYMTLLTPVAFGCFGAYLGRLHDSIARQKESLGALAAILKNQSMIDDITGLYNHRHILEEIEREIERARRQQRSLCGIMVDIDNFKEINDDHGHLVGDFILREAAFVLRGSIRRIDIIGRYGGDEFVVLLPETPYESARAVAERIQENFRRHSFRTQTTYTCLTVSIGLWLFDDLAGLSSSLFVEKVDQAMYKAKSLGKNRIFSCDTLI